MTGIDAETGDELRSQLRHAYGNRLRKIVVYGSRARGSSGPDSDLDIMIVLKGPTELTADLHLAVRALYPLQLRMDFPIHPLPVDERDYDAAEYGLFRRVKVEGLTL